MAFTRVTQAGKVTNPKTLNGAQRSLDLPDTIEKFGMIFHYNKKNYCQMSPISSVKVCFEDDCHVVPCPAVIEHPAAKCRLEVGELIDLVE